MDDKLLDDTRSEAEARPDEIVARETLKQRFAAISASCDYVSLAESRTPADNDAAAKILSNQAKSSSSTPDGSSFQTADTSLNIHHIQRNVDDALRRVS